MTMNNIPPHFEDQTLDFYNITDENGNSVIYIYFEMNVWSYSEEDLEERDWEGAQIIETSFSFPAEAFYAKYPEIKRKIEKAVEEFNNKNTVDTSWSYGEIDFIEDLITEIEELSGIEQFYLPAPLISKKNSNEFNWKLLQIESTRNLDYLNID